MCQNNWIKSHFPATKGCVFALCIATPSKIKILIDFLDLGDVLNNPVSEGQSQMSRGSRGMIIQSSRDNDPWLMIGGSGQNLRRWQRPVLFFIIFYWSLLWLTTAWVLSLSPRWHPREFFYWLSSEWVSHPLWINKRRGSQIGEIFRCSSYRKKVQLFFNKPERRPPPSQFCPLGIFHNSQSSFIVPGTLKNHISETQNA
jgi:hypothetical protein